MQKGSKNLLQSIIRTRKLGLLRLKEDNSNHHFECLKDNCSKNCCWAFDMVQIEDYEMHSFPNLNRSINGTNYLKTKNYNCPSSEACALLVEGTCSKYNDRPASCREYPWYKFGEKIFVDIGCPGVSVSNSANSPAPNSIIDSERYFLSFPRIVRYPLLWLLTKTGK